jgi:GT2 family glycosyltransferase
VQEEETPPIQISVIIVNYKVPEYLSETIRSLREADSYDITEVIVVDNASNDDSQTLVINEFPEVIWIQMKNNVGFGKACNIGSQRASGKFLLFLNPDTVISKKTLSLSLDFMVTHPEVGLMGPKILNTDGTLQASCRRSFPSPADAFFHFFGLSRLFPKSKFFGKYNLTYLNPEISTQVDAISGSFMFTYKSIFTQIGGFDERFFMYGEDLDLCWRVRDTGYKVWYFPGTQIIHRKGKSSSKVKIKSRIAFYEAMVIFSKKYRKHQKGFFPNWLIFVGILFQASLSIGGNLVRFAIPGIADMAIINFFLWLVMTLRFQDNSPYINSPPLILASVHAIITICFLFMFTYNGIYSKKRYSVLNTLLSGLMASILFFATIFFIKSIAFSRIAFGLSSLSISILLVFWREMLPKLQHHFKNGIYSPDRVLIVGNNPIASRVVKNIEEQKTSSICGIIWHGADKPGEYEGYPVIGTFEQISHILKNNKVDILILATPKSWYSEIIEMLASQKVRRLTIQWVPHDYFTKEEEELPQQIPLSNFSV